MVLQGTLDTSSLDVLGISLTGEKMGGSHCGCQWCIASRGQACHTPYAAAMAWRNGKVGALQGRGQTRPVHAMRVRSFG